MPKYEKLEDAQAAYDRLEGEFGETKKAIAALNTENAARRTRTGELEAELERVKRSGETEAEKRARETVGKEYQEKLEALRTSHSRELSERDSRLLRLDLEGAAAKAGLKAEYFADAIRLLPSEVKPDRAVEAFKDLGKRFPTMLAGGAGGPDDSPGSRGGSGGSSAPRCKADLLYKTVKGRDGKETRVADSSARDAYVKEHGLEVWNKLPAI